MPVRPAEFLEHLFQAAIDAVQPAICLPPFLPVPPRGRTLVLGAGKAAAAMARSVEQHWPGPLGGLVVTRYGHGAPCERIEVVEAAHPVPDATGRDAARRMLAMARELTADDLALFLFSGGGSALLALPASGLTLEDKQVINRSLLRSGATIAEMNGVRKHLSAIKGGRLALAACPARMVNLLISDVPGDDPAIIASGPAVADPSSCADARDTLRAHGITGPASVISHLEECHDETPGPDDPRLAAIDTRLIATPQLALEAAAARAEAAGITPCILGDLEGEARDVALVHAGIARQVARHGQPLAPPCVLLSGGETTVTVRGSGRGGRNAEFLLALAVALEGHQGIYALAGDTDGIDGTEDNAACRLDPDTLARARAAGMDARKALANNDGYGFFKSTGGLLITGPTRTNVNDFRAILVMNSTTG